MKFLKDIQKLGGLSFASLYMLLILLSGTFHQHESEVASIDFLQDSNQTKIQEIKHASFQDCFVCHFNSTFQSVSGEHFEWNFEVFHFKIEPNGYASVSVYFQEKGSVFLRGPPQNVVI